MKAEKGFGKLVATETKKWISGSTKQFLYGPGKKTHNKQKGRLKKDLVHQRNKTQVIFRQREH